MAVYVPLEEFEELNAALEPVFDAARKLAEKEAPPPDDDSIEAVGLELEAQTMLLVLQAMSKQSSLTDAAQFLLIGAFVGTVMAQSHAPHAELWRIMRNQVKKSYDQIMLATEPVGHA